MASIIGNASMFHTPGMMDRILRASHGAYDQPAIKVEMTSEPVYPGPWRDAFPYIQTEAVFSFNGLML